MDLTRFDFHVYRFMESDDVDRMTATEVGVYMLLLIKAWTRGKDCTLPDDPEYLARHGRCPQGVPPLVLSKFPLVDTKWGRIRRNGPLYSEWLNAQQRSEAGRYSRSFGKGGSKRGEVADSATQAPVHVPSNERSTNVERSCDERDDECPTQAVPYQAVSNQPDTTRRLPVDFSPETGDEPEEPLGSLQPGEPGYFEEGQYPGGKNPDDERKGLFPYMVRAWQKAKGPSAVCRYPRRFPEEWEALARGHGGDILVPAFELWIETEGKSMTTEMPVAAFTKVAGVYMEKVIPANTKGIRPTVVQSFDERVAADPVLAEALRREEASILEMNKPKPGSRTRKQEWEDSAEELRGLGIDPETESL